MGIEAPVLRVTRFSSSFPDMVGNVEVSGSRHFKGNTILCSDGPFCWVDLIWCESSPFATWTHFTVTTGDDMRATYVVSGHSLL